MNIGQVEEVQTENYGQIVVFHTESTSTLIYGRMMGTVELDVTRLI